MLRDMKPIGRQADLVIQELDNEVLIYDLRANKAFCLNETAARVWQACDGSNSMSDISAELGSDDLVWLALNDLKKQKLIEHEVTTPAKFIGMSRREVMRNIVLSSMLAVPVIAALVAPAAAQAGTVCGIPCTNSSTCMIPNSACGNCGPDMNCSV